MKKPIASSVIPTSDVIFPRFKELVQEYLNRGYSKLDATRLATADCATGFHNVEPEPNSD